MIKKDGRDLAPSRGGRAAGGAGRSAADYAVFYSPIVAESDQWSVPRVVQQHERDTTIVQIANPSSNQRGASGLRCGTRRTRDAGGAASGDDASEISLLGRGRGRADPALARAGGLCPRRRSRRGAHGISHTEGGGKRHGCLHHWTRSISTSGDGMGEGVSSEGGGPGSKTRRQTVDRGQLHPAASGPGREAASHRRHAGVSFS